jgi:hypothetical protein
MSAFGPKRNIMVDKFGAGSRENRHRPIFARRLGNNALAAHVSRNFGWISQSGYTLLRADKESDMDSSKDQAEAIFKKKADQARDAEVAWKEYEEKSRAVRERTAQLRSLRSRREGSRRDQQLLHIGTPAGCCFQGCQGQRRQMP